MSDLAPTSWKPTEVQCFASSRANELPVSFLVDDRKIEVRAVLDSWREPDYLYFKVEAENGGVYELRHHEHEDWWQARESLLRG